MFNSIEQFGQVWRVESELTRATIAGLTDASLSQAVGPSARTLARLAWHLTQTLPEALGRTGLKVDGPGEHEPPPAEVAKLVDAYVTASESALREVSTHWRDDTLNIENEMYGGERWPRSQTLWMMVTHQIHHRGQMSVLMRQAGLKAPSLYGPVREDWATFGMPEPGI